MKHLISIVLFVFGAMQGISQQAEETVYTFSNGDIHVNENFKTSSNIGDIAGITPFKEIGTAVFTANSQSYRLKTLNFNGWRGDGGNFRIVRLYNNANMLLEFIDDYAWRDPFSEFKESISQFASFNDYCIVYPLENNATALIFEGFSWGSQVPLLTIIIIKNNNAKVVFNQSLAVQKFSAAMKGFQLTLIDDFEAPQNIYKLYTTSEGTMKFTKVE